MPKAGSCRSRRASAFKNPWFEPSTGAAADSTQRDVMPHTELQAAIEAAFESRAKITPQNASAELRGAVDSTLGLLDAGTLRVAEKHGATWRVNEWLKKAVLLSFRIADNAAVQA